MDTIENDLPVLTHPSRDALSGFESLMGATTETDALQHLEKAVREVGFDHMLFAVIPQPKISVENAYLRSNYPEKFRRHYDANNLRAVDPTVEYCFKSNGPFVWMPQSFRTAEQSYLYEEAAGHGLRVGVTLPIRGVGGEVGMLTCARDQAPSHAFLKELGTQLGALTLLRDVAFDAINPYTAAPSAPAAAAAPGEEVPELTARERECLTWLTAGKTAWEIGRIMNISEAGVNFHVANLRTKFGVGRRNDVVLKAIRLGLVSMPG
jgi:LuxR family quorum-sensing transcriptional regulator LasR